MCRQPAKYALPTSETRAPKERARIVQLHPRAAYADNRLPDVLFLSFWWWPLQRQQAGRRRALSIFNSEGSFFFQSRAKLFLSIPNEVRDPYNLKYLHLEGRSKKRERRQKIPALTLWKHFPSGSHH